MLTNEKNLQTPAAVQQIKELLNGNKEAV